MLCFCHILRINCDSSGHLPSSDLERRAWPHCFWPHPFWHVNALNGGEYSNGFDSQLDIPTPQNSVLLLPLAYSWHVWRFAIWIQSILGFQSAIKPIWNQSQSSTTLQFQGQFWVKVLDFDAWCQMLPGQNWSPTILKPNPKRSKYGSLAKVFWPPDVTSIYKFTRPVGFQDVLKDCYLFSRFTLDTEH